MRCAHSATHRASPSCASHRASPSCAARTVLRTGRVRRGPGGAAAGVRRPVVAPLLARLGPRALFGRGSPNPPLCARLRRGPLASSLPGPWALGPGSPGFLSPLRPRRCARAPWALGARLPSGARAGAPAAAGRAFPPMACPCVPVFARCGLPRGGSVALACCARAARPSRRAAVLPPQSGGPGGPLGPPPGPLFPASAPPAGGARGLRPALMGRVAPPAGETVFAWVSVAYPGRGVKDIASGPLGRWRAVLDSPSRLCGGVGKALPGRGAPAAPNGATHKGSHRPALPGGKFFKVEVFL